MAKSRPVASPRDRPLRALQDAAELSRRFEHALVARDGLAGAHCIHELWMRGEMGVNIDAALEKLWAATKGAVPEWLPMRHVAWLPVVYDVTARFVRSGRGRSNLYLVLLDYRDSRDEIAADQTLRIATALAAVPVGPVIEYTDAASKRSAYERLRPTLLRGPMMDYTDARRFI